MFESPRVGQHRAHPGRLVPIADPSAVTPIEDYAVIGDGRTAALVSRDGSIDWLCLPGFDSAACFSALLGTSENGRWLLTVLDATEVTRRYQGNSFNLETMYGTPTGTAVIVDAMPMSDGRADFVRQVEVLHGTVRVHHEWIVRFGYGLITPFVRRVVDPHGNEAIRAIAGPDALLLRGTHLPHGADRRHTDTFELAEGETMEIALTWTPSWAPVPRRLPIDERLEASQIRWDAWASRVVDDGPYHRSVIRSLLVLRLLTDARTGGIVAGPHHIAARGGGRCPQLGLPVLLAAGRRAHPGGSPGARLPVRGAGLAGLAAAGGGRRPAGRADHVPGGWRPAPPGARDRPPGLPRVTAGPGRQRGGRPGSPRRGARGAVRTGDGKGQRARRDRGELGPATDAGQ